MWVIIAIIILVLVMLMSNNEKFKCGDKSHCPQSCNPYQLPNMYYTPDCVDPFNWGFTYSTGRCPKAYKPQPRRLPS